MTQIEYILEKEYLYGKKAFKLEQRNFIFANEVFSGDRKCLIENLNEKYPQEEIKDNLLNVEINKFFNDEFNDETKNKNDFESIYISLQYLIIFLAGYNDNNFTNEVKLNIKNFQKYNLNYICKILIKKNYHVNEFLSEKIIVMDSE